MVCFKSQSDDPFPFLIEAAKWLISHWLNVGREAKVSVGSSGDIRATGHVEETYETVP
jgi:hypothetical protein